MVRAEGLGKKYLIRHRAEGERYTALRDVIPGALAKIGRSIVKSPRAPKTPAGAEIEEFWALENVNFEITRGEVVGIVGRNGAGKSTLLKVLSRITEPSVGRVEIRGRVASLLEVGTGFHPELTGRENIFLNGAVLGMTQSEIRRKFDEIVAFAEVEKFLDTPVKRYSSGMYVRLAFAVAAHLEPEILVIDEVLAVGDAQFQKKCLNRVSTITESGRTVLFVSHNIAAIKQVCRSCLYLKRGSLHHAGPTDEVTRLYSADQAQTNRFESALKLAVDLEIVNVAIADGYVESGSRARFEIVLRALADTELSDLTLVVNGPAGDRIAIIDCRTAHYPIAMKSWSMPFLLRNNRICSTS